MPCHAPFPAGVITVVVGRTRFFDYATAVDHFTRPRAGAATACSRRVELDLAGIPDGNWVAAAKDQLAAVPNEPGTSVCFLLACADEADSMAGNFNEVAVRDVPGPEAARFLIALAEAGRAVVCSVDAPTVAAAREFFADVSDRALSVTVTGL